MRPGVRVLVSSILLLVGLTQAGWCGERMISIRSRPYKGKTLTVQGKLYLPLTAYAEAMGLKLRQEGTCWRLDDDRHAQEKLTVTAAEGLFVNGKKLDKATLSKDGAMWINAEIVTKSLGGVYLDNPSLGMVDIGLAYVHRDEPRRTSTTSSTSGTSSASTSPVAKMSLGDALAWMADNKPTKADQMAVFELIKRQPMLYFEVKDPSKAREIPMVQSPDGKQYANVYCDVDRARQTHPQSGFSGVKTQDLLKIIASSPNCQGLVIYNGYANNSLLAIPRASLPNLMTTP